MRRIGATSLVLLLAAWGVAGAGQRPVGDSRVVAQLPPAPGYPEGIAVEGSTIYVATAARFGSSLVPPPGPPEIQSFDMTTGALLRRYAIASADPSQDHGTSGLAFDAAGRLYVLDTQWGIVRFDPDHAPSSMNPAHTPSLIYAGAFPDVPPCSPLSAGACSPTAIDAPSLPNDIAFGPAGDAFVTDSLQATIWRVPAGGGAPRIWFQDARLGGGFGVNGIRFTQDRTALLVTVTADMRGRGVVYRIPLDHPDSITVLHEYVAGEAPDNLAVSESGNLYVALAGSMQISVLSPAGAELGRYSGPARGDEGDVLYDMPSGVALDPSGVLLANNHSEVLGLPRHFVVFDVYVGEGPDPLEMPVL